MDRGEFETITTLKRVDRKRSGPPREGGGGNWESFNLTSRGAQAQESLPQHTDKFISFTFQMKIK